MKKKERNKDARYKNLTRYTRDRTSFQGWRVCISRQGVMFTHYISDRHYSSPEEAKIAAISLRDEILSAILTRPAKEVMEEYCAKYQRPASGKEENTPKNSQKSDISKE